MLGGEPMTKEEKKEYNKKYYLENKDKIRKQNKEYKEKNKEYYKKYQHQYYLKNLNKFKERNTKYYKQNKVKISNQYKEYYLKNRNKFKENARKYYQQNRVKILNQNRQYKKEYYLKLKAKKIKEIVNINKNIVNTLYKKKIKPKKELTKIQIRLKEILKDPHAVSALCNLLSTKKRKKTNEIN